MQHEKKKKKRREKEIITPTPPSILHVAMHGWHVAKRRTSCVSRCMRGINSLGTHCWCCWHYLPTLHPLHIYFYLSAYLLTIATSSSHALETMSLALFTLPAHRNSGANGNVVVVVIVSVTVFVVAVTVVTVAVFVVVVAVTVDVVPSILKKREIIMKIIKRRHHV